MKLLVPDGLQLTYVVKTATGQGVISPYYLPWCFAEMLDWQICGSFAAARDYQRLSTNMLIQIRCCQATRHSHKTNPHKHMKGKVRCWRRAAPHKAEIYLMMYLDVDTMQLWKSVESQWEHMRALRLLLHNAAKEHATLLTSHEPHWQTESCVCVCVFVRLLLLLHQDMCFLNEQNGFLCIVWVRDSSQLVYLALSKMWKTTFCM